MNLTTTIITGVTLAALFATPIMAADLVVVGPARVIDGDTPPRRLKGVDAAERGTERGDKGTAAMRTLVGANELTCTLTGERTHRREVGYCVTADGTDITRRSSPKALRCPARVSMLAT